MTTATFPQITDISQRKAGSPRVLLVRLSAVGDCVQTMPLASAVRQNWPDAHLTWVVEKGAAPLVANCDAVDRLITLPKGFAKSPRLLARLRSELLRQEFHFSLDPQGLLKSGLVAWLTWLFVHLFYLIGLQNRLLVFIRWTFSFLTHGRGARLITGRPPPD